MNKIILGVFAHPDDEAFGLAATLLSEVHQGSQLHLITLTAGEHGQNPDTHEDLGKVRLEEWRQAGQLLGANSMYHLGYIDGTLGNNDMLEVVEKLRQIVKKLASAGQPIEIITLDTNGVTGHIDHIVASRAAHHVFYELKNQGLPLTRLRLACIDRQSTGDTPDTSFVFMEPGRTSGEISETTSNPHLYDKVVEIMKTHHSQRQDGNWHIDNKGDKITVNHFIDKY